MSYQKQAWDTNSYVNPTRMNHIEDGIANALPKDSGGTVNGNVTIDTKSGTTSTPGYSRLYLGNNKSVGTDKNTMGVFCIYAQSGYSVEIYDRNGNISAARYLALPNKSGTLVVDEDSGWQTLTNGTKYRKAGRVVTVSIAITTDLSFGNNVIDTLPSEAIPSITIYNSVLYEDTPNYGTWKPLFMRVTTTGTIEIYSVALSQKQLYGSVTFIV